MGRGQQEQPTSKAFPRATTAGARGVLGSLSEAEAKTLASYEAGAQAWNDHRSRDPRLWADQLAAFQRILPQGRILDVGSGIGCDAALMTEEGYEVTGIDISESLLAMARDACPEAEFHLASAYDLPFEDASFDGAWVVASLLHIPKDRAHEALSEIRRVLKPQHAAFIAVKRGEGEQMEDSAAGERFFAYYSPEELESALAQADLPVAVLGRRMIGDTAWICAWCAPDDSQ